MVSYLEETVIPFEKQLERHNLTLKRKRITTLQVNIGKRCNQACSHCHVESSPTRTENMTEDTVDRLIELLSKEPHIDTVDITGGAPELNPHFRRFVQSLRILNKTVIDRCNLTILFEPNQEDTAQFLVDHQVQIVASLPCYLEDNVDKQRGRGVFDKSIQALQHLNALGYGQPHSNLVLDLVYNPVSPHLPPPQSRLENDYKTYLQTHFGISFNQLYTITNMPIKRYREYLTRLGQLETYMNLLQENFNPNSVENVMCKHLVSIGWDGQIYDCDFNQMLEIPVGNSCLNIWDISALSDIGSSIATRAHCYGCTAGSGSSCGGALLT